MSAYRLQRKRSYILYRIRSEIINRVIDVFAIIAPLATIASLSRIEVLGFLPVMWLHVGVSVGLIAAALLKRRLSLSWRVLLVLSVLQLIGFTGTFNFGLSSNGYLFYLASVVIGGVVLGFRWAVSLMLISAAQLVTFTLLLAAGFWQPQIDFESYNLSAGSWFAALASFVALAAGSVMLQQQFNTFLMELIEDQERQINDRTEQLRRANQTKSDFLSTMSHEIRTPLSTTLGMIEALKNTPLNPEQSHKLEAARNSALSLLSMVNDIMDFARIEAGSIEIKRENFNLVHLVGQIMESFAPSADEKRINLVLDCIPDQYDINRMTIKADSKRIAQVLNNLIDNAVKFTDSGRVVVRLGLVKQKKELRLTCAVEDTGIGLSEEKLQQLSEAFTQSDSGMTRRFSGVGLGLAICKNLIHMMGGELRVRSIVGAGCCFNFEIPIEIASTIRKEQGGMRCDAAFLIADTDYARLEALQRMLLPRMASARTYQLVDLSSKSIEKLANAMRDKFDFILIDCCQLLYQLRLPKDKIAFIDSVRQLKQKVLTGRGTLIGLVSNNDRATQNTLRELGVDALLVQPVTPADVNALVAIHAPQSTQRDDYCVDEDEPTILLVEDHEANAEVVAVSLRQLGLSVKWVANGRTALEWLKSQQHVAMVLMDCQMPEMDGYECTRRIRQGLAGEQHKTIPVVALTAHAHEQDRQTCMDVGMDEYLTKPVDICKLLRVIIELGQISQVSKQILQQFLETKSLAEVSSSLMRLSDLATSTVHDEPSAHGVYEFLPEEIPVWDVSSLRARVLQKESLLQGIVHSFRRDGELQMANLLDVVRQRDLVAIGRIAHGLKGSASNVGAIRVHFLAARIEAEARQYGRVPSNELMLQLEHEMSRFDRVLKEYLRSAKRDLGETFESHKPSASTSDLELFLDSIRLRLEEHDYIDSGELAGWTAEFDSVGLLTEYHQLIEQIQNFDFNSASKSCRWLQQKLIGDEA